MTPLLLWAGLSERAEPHERQPGSADERYVVRHHRFDPDGPGSQSRYTGQLRRIVRHLR